MLNLILTAKAPHFIKSNIRSYFVCHLKKMLPIKVVRHHPLQWMYITSETLNSYTAYIYIYIYIYIHHLRNLLLSGQEHLQPNSNNFYFSGAHFKFNSYFKKHNVTSLQRFRGKSAIYWTICIAFFNPNDIPLPFSFKFISTVNKSILLKSDLSLISGLPRGL